MGKSRMEKKRMLFLIYSGALFICFLPFMLPAFALLAGIVFSMAGLRQNEIARHSSLVLQASIVLMGFGMDLVQVVEASKTGFVITAVSVAFVVGVGIILGRLFKVEDKLGLLISSGTAICGGSAIAAVAPVIQAKSYQISFALLIVFVLNGLALFIFPSIGHYFQLSEEVFGYWAAIAIQDTSSVAGAGAMYGEKALEVAVTTKLVRALWIIPLTIVIAYFYKDKASGKVKFPWFIGLFALSILFAYLLPQWEETFSHFNWLGRRGMVVALFLIGSNVSLSEIKKAGFRSFALGVVLWAIIGVLSLLVLKGLY
jgi:uncharacterized integral membrane protein (TIGR00698 family)